MSAIWARLVEGHCADAFHELVVQHCFARIAFDVRCELFIFAGQNALPQLIGVAVALAITSEAVCVQLKIGRIRHGERNEEIEEDEKIEIILVDSVVRLISTTRAAPLQRVVAATPR